MKVKSVEFELSAVRPIQWPTDGLPEFAFVGRSNVGKSSLLNRLLGRKSLARVSAKPGKTQQINFFRINETFRFADLPGYGYAAVSKAERARFAKMVETYLVKREPLIQVFHLIDIRHEPSAMDIDVHGWMLEMGLPVTVVATKMDKISKSKIAQSVNLIRKLLQTPYPVFPISSVKIEGLDRLTERMEQMIAEVAAEASTAELAGSVDSTGMTSTVEPGDSNAAVSNHHAAEDEKAPDISGPA